MRATVERGAGADSRSSRIQVRRVRKGDLSRVRDVVEQAFADFLERQLGTRPRQPFGGAQYVHHRWLMEPWGCFVAEEDQSRIVGAALGVLWGSVGVLGPVAVLTNYQNQKIGQQLVQAVEEFFEEHKVALHGVVTYPTSPKHLRLYTKFGYRPKALVAITSRALERREGRLVPRPGRPGLAVRRFSSLEEARKKTVLARLHRITGAVCRGLDLSKEIEIVDGLALGDTLLLERGRDVVGFAVCHTPGVSEAPAGAVYAKFAAVDPQARRVEHLEHLVAAVEELAAELNIGRVILPVYTRYWTAFTTLVRSGYQVDFTMVRMQHGKQEDYEDPNHLVLDDWR
ncbi:MAG TPA: GNAT family N-acetyltransferase [Calidithermus sp.]|nr:GNAT family N-acetyltransferase [Calidithermus sp.]